MINQNVLSKMKIYFTLIFMATLWTFSNSEHYTLSLIYPMSDVIAVSFQHYFGAFTLAVKRINKLCKEQGLNVTMDYTIDDSADGRQGLPSILKGEMTLKIIANRSLQNYDAFFGPGLDTCNWDARLAAAYDKPLIGYKCTDALVNDKVKYPTYARTIPSKAYLSVPITSILKRYEWNVLAVLSGSPDDSIIAKNKMVKELKSNGYQVSNQDTYLENQETSYYEEFFKKLKETARVIIFLNDAIGSSHISFMHEAYKYGLATGEYVFYFMNTNNILQLEKSQFDACGLSWGRNLQSIITDFRGTSTECDDIKGVFQILRYSFLLSQWTDSTDNYKTFKEEVTQEMKIYLKCNESSKELIPGFMNPCSFVGLINEKAPNLYDAVILYFNALLRTKDKDEDTRDGKVVMNNAKNMVFQSIRGYNTTINDELETMFSFTVLSMQNLSALNLSKGYDYDWYPFGTFEFDNETTILNAPITKKDWKTFPPKQAPKCGFLNELCIQPNGKDEKTDYTTTIVLTTIFGVFLLVGIYIGLYIYRRRLLLSSMNWKIDESEVHITSPGLDASKMSLTANSGDRGDVQLFTKVAMYKSQLVAVKPFHRQKFLINQVVLEELRDMLELSHENINPFLGIVLNPSRQSMIIYQYCPKGSLNDVLLNDDIKLDSMFLSSFVKDIVKGMIYLHHSSLKSHGRLKSPNCIVDSRWMIKITDYGNNFLRNGLNPLRECDNNAFHSNLLWTAPELLRSSSPLPRGTAKGDVYSFGIILQEIITATEPYAMHELDAIDIINRVKMSSIPVFRPAVQKYHALQTFAESNSGAEIYDLMNMCLSEDPNERPSFTETRRYVKKLSNGKETNVFEHMVKMLEKYSNHLEKVVEDRTKQLIEEKKKTDDLVHRMLPKFIADQLKNNATVEAERYDQVTIYFSDIVGFTTISGQSTPMQVVDLLNDLYTLFDGIISSYDAYKVETIGDAYMVVSGLPIRNGHLHASQIADLSLHLLRAVDEQFVIRHQPNIKLKIRIGIHSGPVAAGVVGFTMPRYCLFGDTVNKASRMEANGIALKVHISRETKELLDMHKQYIIEARDEKVELKNVGVVQTYWLVEKVDHFSPKTSSTSIRSSRALLPPLDVKMSPKISKKNSRRGSNFNFLKKNSVNVV